MINDIICHKRLNIIKILSQKRWNLTAETIRNVYYSLIRSILDYANVIYDLLCETKKQDFILMLKTNSSTRFKSCVCVCVCVLCADNFMFAAFNLKKNTNIFIESSIFISFKLLEIIH